MKKSLPFNTPIHPILFGLYPVLTLYYINIGEVALPAIYQAVITSVVIIIGTSLMFLLFFRSWENAAAPLSFSLILIFTYGHIYNLFDGQTISGIPIGRHRFLIILWGVTLLTGIFLINKMGISKSWTQSLNIISVVMLALIIVQIGFYFIQINIVLKKQQDALPAPIGATTNSGNMDVYYILIDAYSRQDILKKDFDLDTSQFISELEELGFFLPRCAQSNYTTTYSSMTATLNMNYLDALGIDQATANENAYLPYIQQNAVFRSFEKLGYQTVTFKGLHPTIDIKESTYYFDYFDSNSSFAGLDSINFQYLFLKTTIFLPVIGYLESMDELNIPALWAAWLPVDSTINSREYRQYQQNNYALDTLESIPDIPGNKFIYAHLFVTHQPFVFYPDGRFHASLPQDNNAYRDQVLFANKRILEIVKSILEKSEVEPIIIIQSDHSFLTGAERVKILNAYHLPGGGNELLYDTITPVNTFRVVFNKYFGEKYQLLPDISTYIQRIVNNHKELREAPSTCVEEIK